MKKIAVTGYDSMLGKPLIERGCIPLELDITKPNTIERALANERPDLVVNLASISDPDEAEKDFNKAIKVNVDGFKSLCDETWERGIKIVTLSTDHIFSGRTYFDWKMKRLIHKGPYAEDYPRPLPVNAYGMSKLGMETVASWYDTVKVVRTSYCFNQTRLQNDIDKLRDGFYMTYPTFLHRSFMHVDHFIESFFEYLERFDEMPKTLHISGSLTASWHDFVKAISEVYEIGCVKPRKDEDESYTPRPHKVGLKTILSRNFGFKQYDYYDGIGLLNP